jgi:hypothetical protein
MAMASTILRRVPPPGAANGCGRGEVRPQVGHKASQLDPGPGQQLERPWRPAADDLKARLGDTRPNLLDEIDHAVDIGGVREEPEKDHPTYGWGPARHRGSKPAWPSGTLGIELVVDQHYRRQVVASRQLGH